MVSRLFYWMLLVLLAILVALLILLGAAILWQRGAATALIFVGFILLGLLVPMAAVGIALARTARRHRAAAVLAHLAVPIRLNLPLPPMLHAAARSESPRVGVRLARLERYLSAGVSLAGALGAAAPEVGRRELGLLAAAERIGRLPQALARLADDARQHARRLGPDWAIQWLFPLLVLLYLPVVMLFSMNYIYPRFEMIYADYGFALPAVTVSYFSLWAWMWGTAWPTQVIPGLMWLVLAALAAAVLGSVWLLRGLPALDRLVWRVPVLGSAMRDRAMSDSCLIIGEAVTAGLPLPDALALAQALPIGVPLARRLGDWRQRLLDGAAPDAAARDAGLPPLVSGVLASAQAGADLPDALAFLARYYASRFSRAAALLRAAAMPAVVLAVAALVAWFVLAMFVPLVMLIQATADTVFTP